MKSLRKSLNGNKDSPKLQISTPLPLPAVSKPPSAILPPQKVIRALTSHRSQTPQELGFQKGDFFYVVNSGEERGKWYEAHNPVTGARGLVPRDMFEEFNKNTPTRASQIGIGSPPRQVKSPVFYAIVQHDFEAERPDELDAKRGDAITVVAQSNREWFVAKPIGRLGRPGLIPVSFVEIHDPTTGKPITDIEGLMDRGELPKVEDWKKAMLSYKQSSIPLGVLEPTSEGPVSNSPFSQAPPPPNIPNAHPFSTLEPARPPTPELLPEGLLLTAEVVSFHYEMEEYWFRIDALYQPYAQPGDAQLPPARQLILFRVYNDFYDFQVSLLETFPREGGRHPPHPRLLPFMPGPAEEVDDSLTATRRIELDTYIRGLCDLPNSGARYILEHLVVREFLSLKPGDVEKKVELHAQELDAIFASKVGSLQSDATVVDDGYDRDISDKMGRLRMEDERSDGSDYDEVPYNPPILPHDSDLQPHSQSDGRPVENGTQNFIYIQTHARTNSSSSFHSRSHSPRPQQNHSSHSNRNGNNAQTTHSRHDSGYHHSASTPSAASFRSSQSVTTRARSHSNAASNLNNPPISAANPQTAFVKIKIFDRVADDLIAIRVHPKVTHVELMEKVQARLGGEVTILRYRDSITNTFVGLACDEDLRVWMEATDKHVLYAD